MIADRNHLALAVVMVLPLILYLGNLAPRRSLRYLLWGVGGLSVLAVLGTYSRGGIVALGAVIFLLVLQARSKVGGALVGLAVVFALAALAPQALVDRVATIETAADEDQSFQHRLASWHVYFHAGLDHPLTGAGLGNLQNGELYRRYAPPAEMFGVESTRGLAAHNIYFQVWGELGIVGFILYFTMVGYALWSLRWSWRRARELAANHWAVGLAKALFVSIVGFCVGGAALSMAFYDGFLILLALAVALKQIVAHERAAMGPHGARGVGRAIPYGGARS
jgi:probable O-glycosylation ligase (exosortase A-associated)